MLKRMSGYKGAKNQLGAPRDDSQFGYIGPALTSMANTRRWAVVTGAANSIVVSQAYPVQMLQYSPADLLNAVRIAAQGSAVKAYAQSLMPAGGADLTLNLGSVRSFGVRVRISDSPLNFKFGGITVQLLDGATVLAELVTITAKLPGELFILGISNAGGQASPATITNPQVRVFGSANGSSTVSQSTYVWAETLNLRDIGDINR